MNPVFEQQNFTSIRPAGLSPSPKPPIDTRLPEDVPVSVVIATYDRPDALRDCLRCLAAQASPRRIEILVVDNNPASGLTPPVVGEFPEVMLVSEWRRGASYARNAGFINCTGDIIVTTDDDVTMPPDWLEKLIAPFTRSDVMVVTGNVLPVELETRAQQLFEARGGLTKGLERFECNGEWLRGFSYKAPPTWNIGAAANAAHRASIFRHPQIGLMDEALGPGMPSGACEDSYLFYKVLKAGYTLVYEPTAYVWHNHRSDLPLLVKQIHSYGKGHVAYLLTTLMRDGDLRALLQLAVGIPWAHVRRIKDWLCGNSIYPLSLIMLEIKGNLAGPLSLWQSHQRVKRTARSQPHSLFTQRPGTVPQQFRIKSRPGLTMGRVKPPNP